MDNSRIVAEIDAQIGRLQQAKRLLAGVRARSGGGEDHQGQEGER